MTDFASHGVEENSFEMGGVEKMPNGRYYMIVGGEPYGFGYSMFTMVSNGADVCVRE